MKNRKTIGFVIVLICAFVVALVLLSIILFRTYTVSIDAADGSDQLEMEYNINSQDVALGIPVRDGFRFVGWTGSNGETPERNIVIGSGTIGDRAYTAVWSDQLDVMCEDWLIDRYGNPVLDITSEIDSYLNDGKSVKGYQTQARTIQCHAGDVISSEQWGTDATYGAYSNQYVCVGSSGNTRIERDGSTVYRYFYPVLDVGYRVDGQDVTENMEEIAVFTLIVDGVEFVTDVADYCNGIPYGAEYEITDVATMPGYRFESSGNDTGMMIDNRMSVILDFYSE